MNDVIDEKFIEDVRKLLDEHSNRTGMSVERSYEYLLGRLAEFLDEEG